MEVISLPGACQISRKDEKWQRGREATGGWTAAAANPGAAAVLKMGVGEVINSSHWRRVEQRLRGELTLGSWAAAKVVLRKVERKNLFLKQL